MDFKTTNQSELLLDAKTEQLMEENERLKKTILELQRSLEAAEDANRKKSEFLTTVSHEIRTPMNGVLGMIQLLAKTSLDQQQQDYIETIHSSGHLLLSLINDILDFSQIESGKLELKNCSFDISELLEETAAIFAQEAHRKGLELICVPPAELQRHVFSDPTRLRQLLVNLISNAVKFTDVGEVVITAEAGSVTDDTVVLTISVADTGSGVPKVVTDWLSCASGTKLPPELDGIGLGLSISKKLVKLMGSEINIESQVGEGSVLSFTLTLPLDGPVTSETEQVARLERMRVLVVDDNETNLSFLKKIFVDVGADCQTSSSAQDALAQLKKASDLGRMFDLAVVDFNMDEMDGVALATYIRHDEQLYNLPLILMSPSYPEDIEGYFDEVMIKPIRRRVLLSNVGSVRDNYTGVKNASAAPETGNKEKDVENKVLSNVNVLLVEDNLANQKVAMTMLKHLGAQVVVASSGEEAVEKFPVCSADVVLMDCQMPGLDGYQATRIIRAMEEESALPATPIIALTANAMQEDRQLCLDAGMNDYLTKPIEYNLLGQAVIDNLSQAPCNVDAPDKSPSVVGRLQNTSHAEADEINSGLDRVVLSELKAICEDASLYEQIISIYLVESKNLMAELDRAYNMCDCPLVATVAHSLKSSSRNVGARALGQLLEKLEQLAKKDRLEGTKDIYARIGKEFETVTQLLRS